MEPLGLSQPEWGTESLWEAGGPERQEASVDPHLQHWAKPRFPVCERDPVFVFHQREKGGLEHIIVMLFLYLEKQDITPPLVLGLLRGNFQMSHVLRALLVKKRSILLS